MSENNENNLPENQQEQNQDPENQEVKNQEIKNDSAAKINELENKATELNDKLLRALAEIDNVRRRSRDEVERASKYAISGFAGDLVLVVENFFLASEHAPLEEIEKSPALRNFFDAMQMTKKELMKVLEKNQVKRIFPLNEKFDHNFHEAIAQVEKQEGSDVEAGTVAQVVQAGYSISDRLIRPALVGVVKE